MGSRLYTTYLMKHKSDTFTCFKEYKAWAETQFERKIKVFRDDKGGESEGAWYPEGAHC